MNLLMTLHKLISKQPYHPCDYCARDCKDEQITYCSEYAKKRNVR